MKEQLSFVYDSLQGLELKPTPNNVNIMDAVYSTLREVYKEIEEKEGAENDGRTDCIK